ncbi:MAG: class I SAM-dependent methyltransferase [Gaiellaceae bacterium]
MARGSAHAAGSKSAAAKGRRATADPSARNLALVTEEYTETALHFEAAHLPRLLERHLPPGPLALADLGCGDGPLFAALERGGFIGLERSVFAVDLAPRRLARVHARFPWIETIAASADAVPLITDAALDFVCSTMVMEHVPDEGAYLAEIKRVLRSGGRAYVTTVFKKPWAWYFRKRDGESVLDTSHLREYTNVDVVCGLVIQADLRIVALERRLLWFPLLDPLLFRLGRRHPALSARQSLLRALRSPRVPIPGYYSLELVIES